MPTARALSELWATDEYAELEETLERSLEPRDSDSPLETFAALGPQPGRLVVDVGARDEVGAIRLVQDHGLRAVARHGASTVDVARNVLLRSIYQVLGKLCPTVYVWTLDA